jgi:GT2 family glycosyltransferase
MKQVAIVILNYNTQKFLAEFLPSVCATQYSNLKIVVADNASKDDSVNFVKQNFPQIELIVLEKNYGFTGGYNRALKQVTADYYVLLNSDVKVDPNWIQPMVDLVEKNPMIAAIQPKLLDYQSPEKFEYAGGSGGFIDQYGYPYCRGRLFDTIETDKGQYDDARQVFWATGAALFIKADLYHQLGGLDEDFFAHMEEIDLCWRLQNEGHLVWVCPQSVVYHVGGGTMHKSNPRKTFLNFRNGLILLLKNLPASRLLPVIIMRLILDHIAAYRFLFQGNTGEFKAIAKAHFHFIFQIGKWWKKRQVINKNKAYYHPEVYRKSLVWAYFKKGKKVFSEL